MLCPVELYTPVLCRYALWLSPLPVHPLYQWSPGKPTLDHYTVSFQPKTPTSSLTIFLAMVYHVILLIKIVQLLFRDTCLVAVSTHRFLGMNAEFYEGPESQWPHKKLALQI